MKSHGSGVPIVGIGGSAGALDPLKEFFSQVPPTAALLLSWSSTWTRKLVGRAFGATHQIESGRGPGPIDRMVRQIISAHHSSINYTAREGKGTTFHIKLPLD
jgi:hypothetical protein